MFEKSMRVKTMPPTLFDSTPSLLSFSFEFSWTLPLWCHPHEFKASCLSEQSSFRPQCDSLLNPFIILSPSFSRSLCLPYLLPISILPNTSNETVKMTIYGENISYINTLVSMPCIFCRGSHANTCICV